MSVRPEEIKLQDGTLIKHKVVGYEGRIDGTTEIRSCFTARGELLGTSTTKQTFQYRVIIDKELMRRIAPAEDLEILEGPTEVICPQCLYSFQSLPGYVDKPGGRCHCGGWICPSCLACQDPNQSPLCARQRKRVSRMLSREKPR